MIFLNGVFDQKATKAGEEMETEGFAKSALGFTKSPLGIIALFILLVYGFASLVVASGNNIGAHIGPLIWFMVIFPGIVFFGFLWLMAMHHRKLYGPSDFKQAFLNAVETDQANAHPRFAVIEPVKSFVSVSPPHLSSSVSIADGRSLSRQERRDVKASEGVVVGTADCGMAA